MPYKIGDPVQARVRGWDISGKVFHVYEAAIMVQTDVMIQGRTVWYVPHDCVKSRGPDDVAVAKGKA